MLSLSEKSDFVKKHEQLIRYPSQLNGCLKMLSQPFQEKFNYREKCIRCIIENVWNRFKNNKDNNNLALESKHHASSIKALKLC
jgi:hypothetical protein